MRDLLPKRSATSDRSNPKKAHLDPNTPSSVWPSGSAWRTLCSPAPQPWHCWQPRARAGQWLGGFLHDPHVEILLSHRGKGQ